MAESFLWLLAVALLLGSLYLGTREWRRASTPAAAGGGRLLLPTYDGGRDWLRAVLRLDSLALQPLLFVAGVTFSSVGAVYLFQSLFPERVTLSLVAGVAVLPVAGLLIQDLVARRTRLFEAALADVVELMHAASVGGATPWRSLHMAAASSTGFVRSSLAEVMRRVELGAALPDAAAPLFRRYPGTGVALFVGALTAHGQTQGNFVNLLAALAEILRERCLQRQRFLGQLAGIRYALRIAAFFPYLLIPVFIWREPDWLTPLLQHASGPLFVLLALLCQVFGFLWMRWLLREAS